MELTTILLVTVGMNILVILPGLALSLAIVPKRIEGMERLCMSFILGLMPQFILYFISKNFGIPIDIFTTCGIVIVITVVGLGVWWRRKDEDS